jgi:hypothetical protein
MHLPIFWCDGEFSFCIVEFEEESGKTRPPLQSSKTVCPDKMPRKVWTVSSASVHTAGPLKWSGESASQQHFPQCAVYLSHTSSQRPASVKITQRSAEREDQPRQRQYQWHRCWPLFTAATLYWDRRYASRRLRSPHQHRRCSGGRGRGRAGSCSDASAPSTPANGRRRRSRTRRSR